MGSKFFLSSVFFFLFTNKSIQITFSPTSFTMNSEKPALPVPSSSSNSSEEVVNITADNNAHALHKTQSINRPEELQGFEIDLAYEDPEAERVLSRIKSHADPNSQDFNEKDPWKYPVDTVTGFRIVTFVENDKENPMTAWSTGRKWFQTINLGVICFMVAFASGVITGDMSGPMESFNVSLEVVILTVTLFVLGFGVGPLVFAPLSEEFGRQIIYNTTLLVAVVFIIPCAVAKNIGTLLVARFISGVAFSAPMTLIGGSLSDFWATNERGVAMAVFSAAPFLGPVMGPLLGGFIGDYAGWRWIYWVMLIFSGVTYAYAVVVIPETHHATILKRRAKKLRKETGDDRYKTVKEVSPQSFSQVMIVTLKRPGQLFFEVLVFLVTIYMSVIYGLLYMFFFAYPVIFGEGKGWTDHMIGLTFIPIAVGVILSSVIAPWINKDYLKRAQPYLDRGEVPPPELRLIPMMVGCWFVPVGLFIFAWTSYPRLIWVGPTLAGLPCGFGFLLLYNAANNYLVDSYQHYAASALAAKTCVRSIWGAAVPLFTIQMHHRLGYEWAGTLMAFIALACCAIPYLFYFYGATIRQKSKYAYDGF